MGHTVMGLVTSATTVARKVREASMETFEGGDSDTLFAVRQAALAVREKENLVDSDDEV